MAAHVRQEFGSAVECVLDGGAADVGIESTIVDLTAGRPRLLRPGAITAREIEDAAGELLAAVDARAPRAPGTLAAHYAPRTPLAIAERDLLLELAASLVRQGKKIAVLALSDARPLDPIFWIAAPADAAGYAHALYANLRLADESGCDALVVEQPPRTSEWAAVNDRLARAAAGTSAPDEI
jgi:L-threonylcarbamoyladenylate synthase